MRKWKFPLSGDFDVTSAPYPRIFNVLRPSIIIVHLRMQEVYFPAQRPEFSHIGLARKPKPAPVHIDKTWQNLGDYVVSRLQDIPVDAVHVSFAQLLEPHLQGAHEKRR